MKKMMMLKNPLILYLIIIFIKEVTSKGRSKNTKSLTVQNYSHQYDIHQSVWLPSDLQITTTLFKGIPKTLLYWSQAENKSLSAILMPCSSPIEWSIIYLNNYNSTQENLHEINNFNETTKDISIKNFTSKKGLYALKIKPLESNTYMHIYISTEDDGPQALRSALQNNLRILRRGKADWLTVRWEPSLVDPQRTDYCLVINTKNHFQTMCSAEIDIAQKNHVCWELKDGLTKTSDKTYPSIQCVGRKTHLKIPKLRGEIFYYFDLFAINKQSNLTYLLDSTYKKIDGGTKFIALRDGKIASLKKIEGKAVFRFKVGKQSGDVLNFCIIPCGSYLYVDIRLKRNVIVSQIRVDRFKNITIPGILKGQRYIVKVVAPQEDFVNTGVEIFATTRPSAKSPIPAMPTNTSVMDYKSLKTCTSVTIGWMPLLGHKSATYCFIVKEGKIKESEGYSQPNQCGLENRLKKSLDFAPFAIKFCKNINHNNQDVMIKEIKRLKPGKSYIVLVSVKNPKGKSLSYNVLQVNTLSFCNNNYRATE